LGNAPQLEFGRLGDCREIARAGDVSATNNSDADFRYFSPPYFAIFA
jgi:hypothetical protein